MAKMIAIDLDGTMLDDHLQVSQANIDAVNEAIKMGVKIVICTGRTYAGIKRFITEFDYSSENPEYLILGNGTIIRTVNETEPLYQATVNENIRQNAIKVLEQYLDQGLALAAMTDRHFYTITNDEIAPIIIKETSRNKIHAEAIRYETFMQKNNLNKLMFMAEKAVLDELQPLIEQSFNNFSDTVRSTAIILEVLPPDVNKGSGLSWLANHLGIALEDVVVIGDAMNDLSMFEVAGKKIAMENGHPLLREMSDCVTLSNNHSGVAAAINSILANYKNQNV